MDVVGKIETTCFMQDAVGTAISKGLPQDRIDAIGRGFAKIVGISEGEAAELVREARGELTFQKIIRKFEGEGEAGAPLAITMKVSPKEQRRRGHLPASPEDEPSTTPDPALFTPRLGTAKMRHATNAEMLKLAQAGIAEEVRKIRADNPGLTENHARVRIYTENPGLRESLVKMAQGPENEFAKVSSSAEIEAVAKAAEIMNANPHLSEAQAFTKAYETTPGLMKRLLHERSGAYANG